MMCKPVISIVMPAFNVGKYISEAIESVRAQTFTDWELIIADDCSTDETVAIVEGFARKDNRIKLIRRWANSGGGRIPRFDAIAITQGKWVCTLDGDDVIAPDMLQMLVNRQTQTGADMVLNRIIICDQHLNASKTTLPDADFDMNQVISGYDAIRLTINGWKISVTCSLICGDVYRYYVEKVDRKAFSGPFSDEIDHRKMLLTADKIAFVDAHYLYRQQPNSVVHTRTAKSFNGIISVMDLLDFIRSQFKEDQTMMQEIVGESINKLYRYQIEYFRNKKNFTKAENKKISTLIKDGYRRIGNEKIRLSNKKLKLLLANYYIFRTISMMAAKYTNYISK